MARRAPRQLRVSIGQCSDRGRKEVNQDFYGAIIPSQPLLGSKGIAVVLADGISSSFVSRIASEAAVKTFLEDYYCTSETWSVKTSAQRVIATVNSWLFAQTRRGANPYDKDKGYVCTLTAMVIKWTTAHIFHIGDARVCRMHGAALDQLTDDHRVVLSSEQPYLDIIVDKTGTVKIIDFGSVSIAGVTEAALSPEAGHAPGTFQYMAPEHFLGEGGMAASDMFSLGVIAYQLLTGRPPYGADVARAKSKSEQRKLRYRSSMQEDRAIPVWVSYQERRAPGSDQRYQELSKFIFDLRQPNRAYFDAPRPATGARSVAAPEDALGRACNYRLGFAGAACRVLKETFSSQPALSSQAARSPAPAR